MHAPSTLITDCGLIIMKTVQNAEKLVDKLKVFIQQSCGCSRILEVGCLSFLFFFFFFPSAVLMQRIAFL